VLTTKAELNLLRQYKLIFSRFILYLTAHILLDIMTTKNNRLN